MSRIDRIIDANLNRAKEGIRAAEDYARFIMESPGTAGGLKKIRHGIQALFSAAELKRFIASRDSRHDHGRTEAEHGRSRSSARDVAAANIKRGLEALRVLEEYLKPQEPARAARCKGWRYELYSLEQQFQLPLDRLATSKLYIILTADVCRHPLQDTVKMLLDGGADIIQLREKKSTARSYAARARKVLKAMQGYDALFVMNDRPDIARLINADGVHGGQSDLPISQARMIHPGAFIGTSTHSVKQVDQAIKQGADYIGVGPVFKTATKKGRPAIGLKTMKAMLKRASVPTFAIGDINRSTIGSVIEQGARAVAVCRAVLAVDNPKKEAAFFRKALQ